MENKKITLYASIKKITTKTLVSGDKECRIELSIVGADLIEANKLNDLPADKQVIITAEI